ncbi:protein phosphatase 2C domain-containing protein, partial [Streptomyces sp. NPDC056387]|uniref:protein phosphatase 2C domain-containing protein n=1 Tax=Streptomyces sp. NPDC056387 TaxID=3345803 RepID=UPI0035D54D67
PGGATPPGPAAGPGAAVPGTWPDPGGATPPGPAAGPGAAVPGTGPGTWPDPGGATSPGAGAGAGAAVPGTGPGAWPDPGGGPWAAAPGGTWPSAGEVPAEAAAASGEPTGPHAEDLAVSAPGGATPPGAEAGPGTGAGAWPDPGGGPWAAAPAGTPPVAGEAPAEAGPEGAAASRAGTGPASGAGAASGVETGPVGGERPVVGYLGDRAPTYAAEPGALPVADPGALDELVPDTVLEGARHGAYTLRATSVRGDSARFRGEARRDFLLTTRFGTGDDALVLVALAGGDRSAPGAAEAAAELCRWIASAVGRSRERLADDIRAGRRDALRSGLQRLTDRGYGRLRAHAAELGLPEDAYTAGLRVLLLPIDPECKTRICFGAGAGGLFRLRAGAWQDLEPEPEPEPAEPPGDGFRFRAAVTRPRDTLLLCSGGLAAPMREEALLPAELAARWADAEPPGLAAFLADTQLRLKGYADDRTAAAVWEA